MQEYRVYAVSSTGSFLDVPIFFTADSDDEALLRASMNLPDMTWAAELWSDDRLVALLQIKAEGFGRPHEAMSVLPMPPPSVMDAEVKRQARARGKRRGSSVPSE